MLLKKIASFLKGTILVQLIANINEISYPLKKNIYIYIMLHKNVYLNCFECCAIFCYLAKIFEACFHLKLFKESYIKDV